MHSQDGPLGLQVDIEKGAGVGRVVVSGLHPGGQAERLLGGTEDGAGAPAFSLVGGCGVVVVTWFFGFGLGSASG